MFALVIKDALRPLRMMEQHLKRMDEIINRIHEIKGFTVDGMKYQEESATRDAEDKSKFEVRFDLKNFPAEKISVKTYGHNEVVVQATYENRDDKQGLMSSQFYQSFTLPRGSHAKDLISKLSSEGILTITVPRKEDANQERVVPIMQEEEDATQENTADAH